MTELLGIEFTEIGPDFLVARMPVDDRTRQPMGRLHGGASVALAETVGSYAALYCIEDPQLELPVGISINADHVSGISDGFVVARAQPLRLGRRLQVWQVNISNEQEQLICATRLTVALIRR